MFAKRQTPKQQTQADLARQAVDEARRRKSEVEARRSAYELELMQVSARTQSPPADIGAEEMGQLLAREHTLRRLLDASPALERAADAKIRDAEADVVAFEGLKAQIAGRIKDRRESIALGGSLHLKVYYAEQRLEEAKRDARHKVEYLKADLARRSCPPEETNARVSWEEGREQHFIRLAEEELVVARRIFAEAQQRLKADEAWLKTLE